MKQTRCRFLIQTFNFEENNDEFLNRLFSDDNDVRRHDNRQDDEEANRGAKPNITWRDMYHEIKRQLKQEKKNKEKVKENEKEKEAKVSRKEKQSEECKQRVTPAEDIMKRVVDFVGNHCTAFCEINQNYRLELSKKEYGKEKKKLFYTFYFRKS